MGETTDNEERTGQGPEGDAREVLFFDLAKLVFAAIVLGEILLLQENVFDKSCWAMIIIGLSTTYSLAWLGNKILK